MRNKEREQNDDHLRDEGLVPAASDNPDDVDGASGEASRASKTKVRGIAGEDDGVDDGEGSDNKDVARDKYEGAINKIADDDVDDNRGDLDGGDEDESRD